MGEIPIYSPLDWGHPYWMTLYMEKHTTTKMTYNVANGLGWLWCCCGGRIAAVLVEDSLEELAPSCTMSAIWQMIFCLWSLMRCCVGSPRNVKVSRNIKFSGGEIINGGCRARIIFFNCHKMKIFIDKMCFLTELGLNSSILTSIKKVMFMYICQNCQTLFF